MPDVVDLRSDTLTRPSDGMRQAMANAEVGDDVYGEDPSINALEAEVAGRFGHGAAVFVPSGTMGNLVGLRLLCQPGEELLTDADAHIVNYEAGALAAHGGIQTRTVVADRGLLSVAELAPQLRSPGYHTVTTVAVAVEQTHNRGGGAAYDLETLGEIRDLVASHHARLHCDGARIWNAHIATGVKLDEYGALFDTMSVCLSKGLGAPVGSLVLMREAAMAEQARDLRHRLGGAMRQAGILAAAGLYALEHNIERLAEDHEHAQLLAAGLADARDGIVDPTEVQTNIVMLDLNESDPDAAAVCAACEDEGVLVSAIAPRRVRLVTHLDVDRAGVDRALDVIRRALAS